MRRLSSIRHAREFGFEIEAIRTLLALQDSAGRSCAEADAIARARVLEVESRLESLNALKVELERMLAECAMAVSLTAALSRFLRIMENVGSMRATVNLQAHTLVRLRLASDALDG